MEFASLEISEQEDTRCAHLTSGSDPTTSRRNFVNPFIHETGY